MNSPRLARIVFFIAVGLFLLSVVVGSSTLPERIATHFDASGNADGWMSRTLHITSFIALGLGLSAFILGLTFVIRFFPASMLNAPRADYWRQPAHYPRACAYLFNHAFWLAALNTVFLSALHACIVQANTTTPPTFPTSALGLTVGVFFTGLSLWIFFLIRFFYKFGEE